MFTTLNKMNTIEHIKQYGLESLTKDFSIVITDYEDRVVLNYDQIESPRFHPVADECRALILRKNTWEVMARSFTRFYNVGEGIEWKNYNPSSARIQTKLDGSLMSLYWDGEKWCVSTRKKAFAEGFTTYGRQFSKIFWSLLDQSLMDSVTNSKATTYAFELTGPENRVVTQYKVPELYLIGGRNNESGHELLNEELDEVAKQINVKRPESFLVKSFDEVKAMANGLHVLDEGFVLVWEKTPEHYRLKCKNEGYLAIANMRENGIISPKNILKLVLMNEHHEYLTYFQEDKKAFDIVSTKFDEILEDAVKVYDECKDIETQKDFALTIQDKLKFKFASGALFAARKDGKDVETHLREFDAKKLIAQMNLKEQLIERFAQD